MTGFAGIAVASACASAANNWLPVIVTATQGISDIALSTFQSDSPVYYGSYTHLLGPISRGNNGQWGTRSGIVQTAQSLLLRSAFISYAVVSGECAGLVERRYMSAGGSGASIAVNDVTAMRSDAFAEFTYAANGWPNLTRSGTLISITDRASMNYVDGNAAHYTPRFLRGRLVESVIDTPSVLLFAGPSGDTPITNGATSSTTIRVKVEDKYSGPLRLELQGSSFEAVNLNFSAGQIGDTTSYMYTSADLSGLGGLQNGEYSVTAVDQAGNTNSAGFIIRTSGPSNDNKDQTGETLPEVFPSTYCVAGHAEDSSGIASITVSSSGFSDTTYF